MRYRNQKEIVILGFFALTAAIALLFRLSLRVRRRKLVREDAIKKLRASGEFLSAPVSDRPFERPVP